MTTSMEQWGRDVFHDAETQKYKIPAKIINGLRSFGIEAKTGIMSVNVGLQKNWNHSFLKMMQT